MTARRQQKLLYHITDIRNLDAIFREGLKPRAEVGDFVDIADAHILAARGGGGLERYVPFHFYAGTPFAGRIQIDHPRSRFVYITVRRDVARYNGWSIVPRHPLDGSAPAIMAYDEGFNSIDWGLMDASDYRDAASRSSCMAECLAPGAVGSRKFFSIYVKNEVDQREIERLLKEKSLNCYVNISPGAFRR